MATTMVTNELLCFTMFHYGKATKNEILMTIHGFYTDEEVLKAKDVIFDIVNNLPMKVDGIPRLKARKESTNKRRLDCEDILNLIEFADKKQLELPTFCAMDLNRLPRLSPCDVDAVRTAETVEDLKHHVHSLSNEIVEIKQLLKHGLEGALAQRQSYESTDADFPPLLATSSSLPPSSAVVSGVGNSISNGTHGIWAELAENLGTDDFSLVINKKHTKQDKKPSGTTARRVKGSGTQERTKFASSQSHSSWHVFVSRVQPDTSAADIEQFLTENGIRVDSCRKLDATEEWQKKSAAFHLAVHEDDRDKVFVADLWPVNVQVRDWYFKRSVAM